MLTYWPRSSWLARWTAHRSSSSSCRSCSSSWIILASRQPASPSCLATFLLNLASSSLLFLMTFLLFL